MKKLFFIVLYFFIFQTFHLQAHYPEVLNEFIKHFFINSEPAYVLFGSKPVCYYKVNDLTPVSIGTSQNELEAKLRQGIQWWILANPVSDADDYVLKISRLKDGFELLCLNKQRVQEVVKENLPLFQYILGSNANQENIFQELATSKVPFYDILRHDNTLVGILLGFGTYNSILGARDEKLSDLNLEKMTLPYSLAYNLNDYEEAWNLLTLSMMFKDTKLVHNNLTPGLGFHSLQEEKEYLSSSFHICSPFLTTHCPRLIFGNYNLSISGEKLIQTYEDEQKYILSLLDKKQFTELVLNKLKITFSKPHVILKSPAVTSIDIANLLISQLKIHQLDDITGTIEGIQDADIERPDRYEEPVEDTFYQLWVLSQIQDKVKNTMNHFLKLSEDPSFTSLSPHVYFKQLAIGSGNPIDKNLSKGIFNYAIYHADESISFPYTSAVKEPLNLSEVILGLAAGVQNMRPGEIREIHIHPEAAYGLYTKMERWQSLKIIIQLNEMDVSSSPLNLQLPPLKPDRSLLLSSEDLNILNDLKKQLAYFEAKSFWNFFKQLKNELNFSTQDLINTIVLNWNDSIHNVNQSAIDAYSLKIWKQQQNEENKRFLEVVNDEVNPTSLNENKLYVKFNSKGNKEVKGQNEISLKIKNLNGETIKESHYKKLSQEEFMRLNKGLQIALENCCDGDSGVIYIHPELVEQSLFRNPQAHKAQIVEFQVNQSN